MIIGTHVQTVNDLFQIEQQKKMCRVFSESVLLADAMGQGWVVFIMSLIVYVQL